MQAGFELDASIASQPVAMVGNLESKLEEYLVLLQSLPPEVVE